LVISEVDEILYQIIEIHFIIVLAEVELLCELEDVIIIILTIIELHYEQNLKDFENIITNL
jgi:hypothetical protein